MWVDASGRLPTHTVVRHILMREPASQSEGNQVSYQSTWFQGNDYKDALKKAEGKLLPVSQFPYTQATQQPRKHLPFGQERELLP